MEVEYAGAMAPLLLPGRYKGAYGGRGGTKSHFFAEQVILRAYAQTARIVCIREVQNSIKDSVRQLLVDKISKFGWEQEFEVTEREIRCPRTNSVVIFKGMQNYNSENIKSLEGYDVAWVEEAQTLSARSLELLRPTIRKQNALLYGDKWFDSEIWFSWNPRHRTDPVDVFFRKNPHPDAISVFVNYTDNPWFPDVLRREMEHDYETDPEKAEHVWGGGYGVDEGAIIARLVDRAEKDGRLNDCQYTEDGGPIEISSDIGFRDTASWWFFQRLHAGTRWFHYEGESGLDGEEWIERLSQILEERGWPLGRIWLPHDARVKTFQSRHSVIESFLKAFGTDKVRIVPRTSKTDRINAGRKIIRTSEINAEACEEGLDGLRAWVYEWDTDKQVFSREPLHNWASHPSDAFTYGCQVIDNLPPPEDDRPKARFFPEVTANEVFFPEPKGHQGTEHV